MAGIVLAAMIVIAVGARLIGPTVRIVEQVLLAGSVVIMLFVMAFVGAEVVMRYVFRAPIEGHLEGSELLAPVIVFFAFSYTQATHGHVGMDLVLDLMAPGARRWATVATLIASIFICAIFAWFSYKLAYQQWDYDGVTASPPYYKTWPAAASLPIGYALCAVRMFLQVLNLVAPDSYPDYAPALPEAEHIGGPE
ncbi:MAG: TRAP transporter small permease [Hyphomicrobiaceae bacterium]|nr:TRAP transporter small permease [Hyphomicrobiaceae bacterium]